MSKRLVIIGGVAAGASAAAKARRTSEDIEIVMVEAGPYISFANCGLPYYVGGEIADRDDLFVVGAKGFAGRFNVDVRTRTRATSIDRQGRTVTLAGPDGETSELAYDRLVLATGTLAVQPPIEGLRRPDVFMVRTVPDVDAIVERMHQLRDKAGRTGAGDATQEPPTEALVIGGGYIGLETAEQLLRRGVKVTVVEIAGQVMGPMDPEMAYPVQEALVSAGAKVLVREGVKRIDDRGGRAVAVTTKGSEIPFDIGILGAGVKPNVELARQAGVDLGETGAIAVDGLQRTSDTSIYAAGDNSELPHAVLGKPVNIPLAGPANKAGRAAGANAALDMIGAADEDPRRLRVSGVLGTGIVRVCGMSAGLTGLAEKDAQRHGVDYAVLCMPGASHAGYFPGATPLLLKVLYDPQTGKLLGAQGAGADGVDKRLDVLATAISAGMTVEDLENLDLCYAPPFGSAKDLEIQTGFAAANARRGLMPVITTRELLAELDSDAPPVVVDVRTQGEYQAGHLDGAVNIPVDEVRQRMDEIPADRPVVVHCAAGYRSYVAQRILMNAGRSNVRNITGGYKTITQTRKALAQEAVSPE